MQVNIPVLSVSLPFVCLFCLFVIGKGKCREKDKTSFCSLIFSIYSHRFCMHIVLGALHKSVCLFVCHIQALLNGVRNRFDSVWEMPEIIFLSMLVSLIEKNKHFLTSFRLVVCRL